MPAWKEDYTDLPLKANPTQNFFLSSASVSSTLRAKTYSTIDHFYLGKRRRRRRRIGNFKPCKIAATYRGEIKRVHYQMLGHIVARSYWCSKGIKTQCYCGTENSRIWGTKEKSRDFRTTVR